MTRIDPNTLNTIVRRLREAPKRPRWVKHETLLDSPGGSDGPFLVVVDLAGGSPGGPDDGTCSYTYNVKDARTLETLAEAVAPENGRMTNWEYIEAGAIDEEATEYEYEYGGGETVYVTSPYGLADYDNDGNLLLWVFGETPVAPAGAGQYKVLQLNADDLPAWDWVRAH